MKFDRLYNDFYLHFRLNFQKYCIKKSENIKKYLEKKSMRNSLNVANEQTDCFSMKCTHHIGLTNEFTEIVTEGTLFAAS